MSSSLALRAPHPSRAALSVLDLFSGIGGLSLGLKWAGGFKTVAFCEIDPFCRRVLAKHWPGVPIHEDVTKLRGEDVGPVDVICGGFPCQDISFAGLGAGIQGERSGLWREYARLIGELRPSFVIVENVAALLGRGLNVVLGDLAARGYDAWWDCIPAAAVGAPHIRDRAWIVAYPGGQQHEGFGDALGRSIAAGLSAAALAHAARERCGEAREHCQRSAERPTGCRQVLADSERVGCLSVVESELGGPQGQRPASAIAYCRDALRRGWWSTEPDVGRVAHGVPARVDRLRGLGNAVVPQIQELIGRAILEAERAAA